MKNITVSVDEETHRLARIRAAEMDTSVSALVRDYLKSLVDGQNQGRTVDARRVETARERRRRLLNGGACGLRCARRGAAHGRQLAQGSVVRPRCGAGRSRG